MNSNQKNNQISDLLRTLGNKSFAKSKYFNALLYYNHSLCFAKPESTQISFAYANRSAVYLNLRQFELCLHNIELAKLSNYPSDKMEKLIEREEQCKELMKTSKSNPDDDPFNFFKLSYPANEKYPGIVDCLELRNNRKFGNYFITTKDLKAGDVIGIEEPSFSHSNAGSRLHRCFHCCDDVLLNLLPCHGCSKAMFCSDKCRLDALNEVHRFECGDDSAPSVYLDNNYNMRMLLKFLNVFAGDVDELKKFLDENKKRTTIFDFDFSDPNDPMRQKNFILAQLALRNNSKQMGLMFDYFKFTNKEFVNCHPKLKKLWREHGRFLDDLLEKLSGPAFCCINLPVRVSQPINLSNESLFQEATAQSFGDIFIETVGVGFYPAFLSLNGSCNGNVGIVPVGNKAVWVVNKPVPAGAQLFREYISQFFDNGPAAHRREENQKYYGFTCECEACKRDWPTLDGLKAVDPNFKRQQIRSLSTRVQAQENIKKYVEYIDNNYQHKKPTKEVYVSIVNMDFELHTMAKPSFYP